MTHSHSADNDFEPAPLSHEGGDRIWRPVIFTSHDEQMDRAGAKFLTEAPAHRPKRPVTRLLSIALLAALTTVLPLKTKLPEPFSITAGTIVLAPEPPSAKPVDSPASASGPKLLHVLEGIHYAVASGPAVPTEGVTDDVDLLSAIDLPPLRMVADPPADYTVAAPLPTSISNPLPPQGSILSLPVATASSAGTASVAVPGTSTGSLPEPAVAALRDGDGDDEVSAKPIKPEKKTARPERSVERPITSAKRLRTTTSEDKTSSEPKDHVRSVFARDGY